MYESFYGGRAGASFRIVKRFDGIDIPQEAGNEVYHKALCAVSIVNNVSYFKYPLVFKNEKNYDKETWAVLVYDGQAKNIINDDETTGTMTFDAELAEGMVQCFKKGGETTSIVNYGEYVIIDTIEGLNEFGNPENGKIFRRGMDFSSELGGAEYQGQIVGPRGESVEMYMDSAEEIIADGGEAREYTKMDGLKPGKTEDGEFNDTITYTWLNYKDEAGNLNYAAFGFTFPYLVQEFKAESRSPYYQAGDDIPTDKQIGDLLPADFNYSERIDNGEHPFFEEWKFNLPKGIKGDTVSNLQIYPTKAKAGCTIYNDWRLTDVFGTATGNEEVNVANYDVDSISIPLNNGKFISMSDGVKRKMRYKLWNYDNIEIGENQYVDAEEYDAFVDDIDIDTDSGNGDEGSGSQKIGYKYNTSDTFRYFGQPINYILDTYRVPYNDAEVSLRNHLLIYYSDPVRRAASAIANKSYFSVRLNKSVTGWTDLGDVKGDKGNINILDVYPTLGDVPQQSPEAIMGGDNHYAGYAVLLGDETDPQEIYHLAIYDYVNNEWHDVGAYLNDITQIIALSTDPTPPAEGGYILNVDTLRNGQRVVTDIAQRTEQGEDNYPIGPELVNIGGLQNSNIGNFEQEILLGTDYDKEVTHTLVTEDDQGQELKNPYIRTVERIKYRIDGSTYNYYILEREIHKQPKRIYNKDNNQLILNLEPKIYFDQGILYYYENSNIRVARQVISYNYSDPTKDVITSVVTLG